MENFFTLYPLAFYIANGIITFENLTNVYRSFFLMLRIGQHDRLRVVFSDFYMYYASRPVCVNILCCPPYEICVGVVVAIVIALLSIILSESVAETQTAPSSIYFLKLCIQSLQYFECRQTTIRLYFTHTNTQ